MARVNHKLVKKLLNEKRSKITDQQFFISRVLAGHFEDMAAAQSRRYNYGRRVQLFWKPKSPDAAHTDHTAIYINSGFPLVTKIKGRENRYQMVCGMFAHELGHVLYTDFLTPQTQAKNMDRGRWYPEPPTLHTAEDFANEKALWAYLKADSENLEAVKMVSHHIANVLEDGSCHIFESILEVMPSYVKFGQIKYGDEPLSDERIQTTFDLITELDRVVTEHDPKGCLNLVKRLSDMALLIKNVTTYQKTKPLYEAYRKARNKEKYRAEHERGIILHEAAAKALKAAQIGGKLPSVPALQAEYEKLQAQKESLYADYGKLKKQVQEYDVIKRNIDSILQTEKQPERERQTERE